MKLTAMKNSLKIEIKIEGKQENRNKLWCDVLWWLWWLFFYNLIQLLRFFFYDIFVAISKFFLMIFNDFFVTHEIKFIACRTCFFSFFVLSFFCHFLVAINAEVLNKIQKQKQKKKRNHKMKWK